MAKPFLEYQHLLPSDLDLEVWPNWYFLKSLTLLISFKQWELETWFFTCLSYETKCLPGYQQFLPLTLTLEFDLLFENFHLACKFWTLSAVPEHWYFTWMFNECKLSWLLDLDLGGWPFFMKTLTLHITFKQWVFKLRYLI